MRLLLLTPAELSRDPRARRAAAAARAREGEVVGLCGRISGEEPVPLQDVQIVRVGRRGRPSPAHESGILRRRRLRELRGLYRLGRLGARTLALRHAGRRLGSFDVIHANDFDTLPAGWLLARRAGARLVYDAHELYSAFDPDPPRLYRAVAIRLEAALARRADVVVTVSEPMADELVRTLGLHVRPLVVLDAPELQGEEPLVRAGGPLRAVYQGAFGPGRPLGDLLDAIRSAPSSHLTIRVVRTDPRSIRAAVVDRGLAERVTVAEPLPPDGLAQGLRGFDVGVVFDRPDTRNSELSLPNKLFDYLMAGLAVVAPRLPALAPLIEGAGVGVTFEPGNPAALAGALEGLAGDPERLRRLRRAARGAAVTRYNAAVQAQVLAQAWDADANTARPPQLGRTRAVIGPTDVAGTASALAYGMQALGVDAEVVLSIPPYGSPSIPVLNRRGRLVHAVAAPSRRELLHYQFGTTWLPWYLDAYWARAWRRTLLVTYHGDDCRSYSLARVLFPARGRAGTDERDHGVRRRMRRLSRVCHAALVADLELATYVSPAFRRVYVTPLPLHVDVELEPGEPRAADGPLVVLHAPSDPQVKGTAAIVRAVEAVARRHPVDLRLVTGVTREHVVRELRGADIVVDQLNSVTSGVFALEAMAAGLPVLGELDDSVLPPYQADLPVVPVTAETLEEELEALVLDPARRARLAVEGCGYVARNHDPVTVARTVLEIYRHARIAEPGVYQATVDGIVPLPADLDRI